MSFSCQDEGTIVVTSAGLNWNDLTWNPPTLNAESGVVAASGNGNTFSVLAQTNPGTNVGSPNCDITSVGLVYTGGDVLCNLHMDVTNNDTIDPLGVIITQDGNEICNAQPGFGVFDIPFTVTGGIDTVLMVEAQARIGNVAGLELTAAFNASLTPAF